MIVIQWDMRLGYTLPGKRLQFANWKMAHRNG